MKDENLSYWIIEHLSYGVLMKWERGGLSSTYPRFSWSSPGCDGIHYATEDEAKKALEQVKASGRLGAYQCYISEMNGG